MKTCKAPASEAKLPRRFWFFLCLMMAAAAVPAWAGASAGELPSVNVTFFDERGRELCRFEAEAAVTPHEQARGLMFRTSMRRRSGMLFVHDREDMQNFWMKNTCIPLDLIFINARYEVVHVHKGARPHDERDISSRYPARYVLEVNAGEAKECSLTRGVKARFSAGH